MSVGPDEYFLTSFIFSDDGICHQSQISVCKVSKLHCIFLTEDMVYVLLANTAGFDEMLQNVPSPQGLHFLVSIPIYRLFEWLTNSSGRFNTISVGCLTLYSIIKSFDTFEISYI